MSLNSIVTYECESDVRPSVVFAESTTVTSRRAAPGLLAQETVTHVFELTLPISVSHTRSPSNADKSILREGKSPFSPCPVPGIIYVDTGPGSDSMDSG
jgi:hypothetical protein